MAASRYSSRSHETRHTPSEEEKQEKPWKYYGYRSFSRWVASDNDFFVVRRFESLAARVLLKCQWEISELEAGIEQKDLERIGALEDVHNGTFRRQDSDVRGPLLDQALVKIARYHELLLNFSQLKARDPASESSITNVKNWLSTFPTAIDEEETEFLNRKDDLISVFAIPRTPLRRCLEKSSRFRWSSFAKRVPRDSSYVYDAEITRYLSDSRIDHLVNYVICLCGFILLVVPLWILYFMPTRTAQLAVITAFIFIFLGCIQTVTVPRPFESLAATAAYSAVLMVFMQIGIGHH